MKKLGIKLTSILGVLTISLGLCIPSICSDKYVVVVVMGFGLGWGSGSLFLASLIPCWEHFKNYKARVTGILMIGYSVTPFVYCLVFTYISNPENIGAGIKHPVTGEAIFPISISYNISMAFLIIGIPTLIIGCISSFFIFEKTEETPISAQKEASDSYILWKAIKSQPFIRLFLIGTFKYMFFLYILPNFKSIGLVYLKDDYLTTYSSTISWIPSIIGKILWIELLEKYSYNTVIGTIIACHVIIAGTLPLMFSSSMWFTVWMSIVQFTSSALYPSIVIETGNTFSSRTSPLVIPYISISCTIATIFQPGFNIIADKWGYEVVCYITMSFCIAALCIMFLWKKQKFIEEESEKELIEKDTV